MQSSRTVEGSAWPATTCLTEWDWRWQRVQHRKLRVFVRYRGPCCRGDGRSTISPSCPLRKCT